MGTNYYLEPQPPCPHCGRAYEGLHIGKSSAGWCFSLHVIPEEGLNSLEDWEKRFISETVIRDEYGDEISREEMLKTITDRKWKPLVEKPSSFYDSWEQFYSENHAEPGPNNLFRNKIDGVHCVGHGSGTWDLIQGEFR